MTRLKADVQVMERKRHASHHSTVEQMEKTHKRRRYTPPQLPMGEVKKESGRKTKVPQQKDVILVDGKSSSVSNRY